MKVADVVQICHQIAPKHQLNPKVLTALVMVESSGDANAVRLEQGYYSTYVRTQLSYPPVVEILLSCSYGLTQCMGDTLRQMGYFNDRATNLNDTTKVSQALDDYLEMPQLQVEMGAQWLRKKIDRAKGDEALGLIRYNGSKRYADIIYAELARLEKQGVFEGIVLLTKFNLHV
jgi:hypothetical protein